MACGTPVIATDVGGIPELVDHGETGLLIETCDERSLAEAIIILLNDQTMSGGDGLCWTKEGHGTLQS